MIIYKKTNRLRWVDNHNHSNLAVSGLRAIHVNGIRVGDLNIELGLSSVVSRACGNGNEAGVELSARRAWRVRIAGSDGMVLVLLLSDKALEDYRVVILQLRRHI
jgi:hypothetical protein